MKQDWEISKLGDLLVKTELVDPRKKPNEKFEYLDVSSVNKETKVIEGAVTLLGKEAPSRARKLVKTNDIIFATVRPTHGRVAIITEEFSNQICSTGYFVLRGNESIESKYLYYFLLSNEFNQQMEKLQKGASYPAVTDAEVKGISLSYPKSKFEQIRIISKLDKAFAKIEKVKANAEKNLQSVRELLDGYLQRMFDFLSGEFEKKKLGDVCIVERGSSPRPIEKYQTDKPDGVNWIKIGDTKDVDKYIFKTKEKITKEGALKSRYVKDGDFILSNSMSFGRPYIMKTDGYIHDGWFVFRLPEYLDKDYFYYFLTSPIVQRQIQSLGAGAIVKNISGDLVKKVDVYYPKSVIKQRAVVGKIEALRVEIQKLEILYKNKLDALNELKQSVLKQALLGNL